MRVQGREWRSGSVARWQSVGPRIDTGYRFGLSLQLWVFAAPFCGEHGSRAPELPSSRALEQTQGWAGRVPARLHDLKLERGAVRARSGLGPGPGWWLGALTKSIGSWDKKADGGGRAYVWARRGERAGRGARRARELVSDW